MIATVQIERFGLTSSRPCDEILAAIKAAVGHPDMVEFAKRTAAAPSFPEFESIVREGLGTTGLMLFMELDHGAVIRKATSSCHRNRTGKLRRSDDQSIAVGCFCQCPDSGRHGRPSAWGERNEMVAYFFNVYFGQARCGVSGHGNHSRSKPETAISSRFEDFFL
jgi:hypothetical protein